jgi:hypothetical protein
MEWTRFFRKYKNHVGLGKKKNIFTLALRIK